MFWCLKNWRSYYLISPLTLDSTLRQHLFSSTSVQFSHSVVSDSLQPHELQYAGHPCLSPTPGVHPNPCSFSRWCHPTISSSVVPFIPCPFCFFDDPVDVGNLISGSSAFSKTSLNLWKFMVHVLVKPALENFKHYFTSMRWMQLCGSLSILWHCLSLGLEWKLTFSSPVATAEFSKFAGILSAALSQHNLSGFEIAQLEFHHLH